MRLTFTDETHQAPFEALRDEWNALVERHRSPPFHRHELIDSFLHNFLPGSPMSIVTGRDSSSQLTMILPLVRVSGTICGIPVRELSSPTNVHSLRFDLIAPRGDLAVEEFSARSLLDHFMADRSWDVLRLTDIPKDGSAWAIYRAALAAGLPAGAWESQRSPYLSLPAPGESPPQGLRTKFRANLRRRRKRLSEKGDIEVVCLRGDSLGARDVEACLAMECSGWKGRAGSAAIQDQRVLGFHLALMASPGYKPLVSIHLLKLSGRPIAFQYGVTSHGVFSLVMTSYDEAFAEFSPGHLLTEEVLNDCVQRGLREFDFLGCDLPWKLEWTATVRPHFWLYIFRNSVRGRLLRRLKFDWAVAARQLLTKIRMPLLSGRAGPKRAA